MLKELEAGEHPDRYSSIGCILGFTLGNGRYNFFFKWFEERISINGQEKKIHIGVCEEPHDA